MRIQLAIAACAISSAAAQPVYNFLTPEERAAGWRLLFDGKSLQGWEDPVEEKPAGNAWIVADGCIK
ncbi:MAG: 3-keto-disaccharide hydrolase, partial [Bryobacteraceae bacterium]